MKPTARHAAFLTACIAALSLGTLRSAPALANPVDAFGFGPRAAALGSAQTAATEDGGANYYNPGRLAAFTDIHFDAGYQVARPNLQVNGLKQPVDDSRGTLLSIIMPGRIGGRAAGERGTARVGGLRLALGGAVFLPDQHISRTRALANATPRFVMYDNRPQRVFIAANLAAAIGERLFIGAGLAYMSSTQGDVLLDGRIGFPRVADSDLSLAIDVDLKTIRYPQAGLYYRALPWLDLGLSYRGGFRLTVDQVFVVRGDIGPARGEPLVEDGFFRLHSASQDLFQPAQVTAGALARLTPALALAFDLQWQRWSAYENPAARVEIELDVGQFNDLVDIPTPLPLSEADFRDVLSPRLGLEWAPLAAETRSLKVRGGYVYEPSPVPPQYGETNFIDGAKHTLSLGIGLTLARISAVLPRPLSLDAHVGVTLLDETSQTKLFAADPIGDYSASGRVLQAGFATRWRF